MQVPLQSWLGAAHELVVVVVVVVVVLVVIVVDAGSVVVWVYVSFKVRSHSVLRTYGS